VMEGVSGILRYCGLNVRSTRVCTGAGRCSSRGARPAAMGRVQVGSMHNRVTDPLLCRVRKHVVGVAQHNEFEEAYDQEHEKHHHQSELNQGLTALSLPKTNSLHSCHRYTHQFMVRISEKR